jgi:phosphate uptake regulator
MEQEEEREGRFERRSFMKRTVLDNDLQELDARVIRLGTLVEDALALALKALEESDQDKAGEVVLGDNAIDDLHLAIEEHALRILTLQQPLGGRDLRYLSSVAPIAIDLERIGWEGDRVVDHHHYVIQRDLMEMLEENKTIPALVHDRHLLRRVTYLLWIAHKLERASDHCTNICERVVFIVEGATDIASLPGG